jgi:hypothetical protein
MYPMMNSHNRMSFGIHNHQIMVSKNHTNSADRNQGIHKTFLVSVHVQFLVVFII